MNTRTRRETPNRLNSRKSEPGAAVRKAGSLQLMSLPGGSTQLLLRLEYETPGGQLGRAVAALFGAEPGQQAENNFMTLKRTLESDGGLTTFAPTEIGAQHWRGHRVRPP